MCLQIPTQMGVTTPMVVQIQGAYQGEQQVLSWQHVILFTSVFCC
jgi:hypothetical protein